MTITAERAQELLDGATKGPRKGESPGWYIDWDSPDQTSGDIRIMFSDIMICNEAEANNARLIAAAPDLARTVIAQAAELAVVIKDRDIWAAEAQARTSPIIAAQVAELTRLRAKVEWQPIATVPTDDTMFLAYCPPDKSFPKGRMMMWSGKVFAGTDKAPFHLQFPATHWLPLPEKPAMSAYREVKGHE